MIYVAAQIYPAPEVAEPLTMTYTLGCTIGLHFMFVVYLFFVEKSFPDHWRHVRDEGHAKAGADDSDCLPSNFPLTKKFWRMVDITYSQRMIGWVRESRMPCRGPVFAPCAFCPVTGHYDGSLDELCTQCHGFSMCRPLLFESHTVAGYLGPLGRRISTPTAAPGRSAHPTFL